MNAQQPARFSPPRRRGLLLHLGAIVGFSLVVTLLFLSATRAPLGLLFLLYLLGALFLAIPVPVLVYRLYALLRSKYEIGRNGIRLQWGFREEDIPMTDVLWVRLPEEFDEQIPLPRFRWPGAIIGIQAGGDFVPIEFMASESDGLAFIGTADKIFAISPKNPSQFQQSYQEMIELGSLAPLPPYSAYPRFLPIDIWRLAPIRAFLIVCVVISIALFVWVGLVVPAIDTVSLGFSPAGVPLPPVSAGQLFILPVANILLLMASYSLSLYFFRQSEKHPLIYVLWGSSAFTGLLFLAAVYFILQTN